MKQLTSFEETLGYVYRLGFAGAGSVQTQQEDLCRVAFALELQADSYPFRVTFHTYRSEEGFTFPWLGSFTLITASGETRTVDCSQIQSIAFLTSELAARRGAREQADTTDAARPGV